MGDHQPFSLAAAKLERQNKRIETANAALTAQAPTEKHKHSTRGRSGKAWKPFDFTDAQTASQSQMAGIPAVESRVNVFRAPSSYAASLSRPVSRVSSRTQASTVSDAERRDSTFLESDDFQLFTGRRKGRPTHEERSSTQLATVEATFNKRDITDIFGNELPGPGFMDGNPGNTNGQLQFTQHPNGDVAAHMWSSERFGWENIGQFSNIRKKVEGQLANSRLKNETASQALQQNTLAYFRAVAKQREADVMGLSFGPREIAACLPDIRPPSTAPTGPKRVTSKVEMPERPTSMQLRHENQNMPPVTGVSEKVEAVPPKPAINALQSTQYRLPPQAQRFNPSLNFTPVPRANSQEDPFVSATPYRGGNGQYHMPFAQMSYYSQWTPPVPFPAPYYMGQSHAPPYTSYPSRENPASSSSSFYYSQYDQSGVADQVGRQSLQQSTAQQPQQPQQTRPYQQYQQSQQPQQTSTPAAPSSAHSALSRQTSPAKEPAPRHLSEAVEPSSRSRAASPLETRLAMREHVMKMGQQAKERSISQANIRTVLYDPFQDKSPTKEPAPAAPPSKLVIQDPTAAPAPAHAPQKHAPSNFGFPFLGMGTFPGLDGLGSDGKSPFPTTLAPFVKMPFPVSDDLRDSSPDREWHRSSEDDSDNPPMLMSGSSTSKLWDPDKLDDWLWSGNKFARQEDFHNRIMASDGTPSRRSQPSSTRPIGPASRSRPQSDAHDSNVLTNRILVPVLENLASYVQGPIEKRRDYFCPWTKAPEWAIDRSANGNNSFFDNQWGQPPARVGRDPRYQPVPREMDIRFGAFQNSPQSGNPSVMDRRFGFQGRF